MKNPNSQAQTVLKRLEEKDPYVARMVKDANDKTLEIYDMLVPHEPKGKLPENIFKEYFLPYFSGELTASDKNNVFSEWVGVAGSPMSEVEIIDEEGKVLFDVPALFTSNMLNVIDRKPQLAMNEIIQSAVSHQTTSPIIGMRFLNNTLQDKFKELTVDAPSTNPNSKRWDDIFIRYNKKEKSNAAPGSTPDDSPDVDYS